MFPIRDTIRSRSFPLINWLLIAANAFVFLIESSLSPAQLERFINTFALVPAHIDFNNPLTWLPFLTHIFLHAGWFHILSNIWMLYIFGDNVEDRLGSTRYLLFYLLGGIAAGALQYYFSSDPSVPALGASGAIAAVMGAYFIFYPKSRVITFVPIFLFGWFVELPSILFLGVWFITQLFSGILSLSSMTGMQAEGVAWWAHIGGFLFGLIMAIPFTIGRPKRKEYIDEYYPY